MSDVSQIDGNAVRLRRESQGLGLADLATRACLSVKQVRQIEEGGMTAFYSETVKLTAARKVAGLLQMAESQLFGQPVAITAEPIDTFEPEDALAIESVVMADSSSSSILTGGLNNQHNAPLTRSEALHVLAQPPEHLEEADTVHDHSSDTAEVATENTLVEPSDTLATSSVADTSAESSAGGGYLLKILALFLVALAAAALLKPSALDDKAAMPSAEAVPASNLPNSNSAIEVQQSPRPVADTPAAAVQVQQPVAPAPVTPLSTTDK